MESSTNLPLVKVEDLWKILLLKVEDPTFESGRSYLQKWKILLLKVEDPTFKSGRSYFSKVEDPTCAGLILWKIPPCAGLIFFGKNKPGLNFKISAEIKRK